MTHTYAPGNYTAQLVVTDNQGAFVHRLGHRSGHQPPARRLLHRDVEHGPAPLAITANAAASSDPTARSPRYAWDFDTAGVFPGDSGHGRHGKPHLRPGRLHGPLTVTDNNGVTATTTRTITVTGAPGGADGARAHRVGLL